MFLNGLIIFQGVIGGPQTNKKLCGKGWGSKIQPWGDMGKILVFGLIFQKKILKNQGCILEHFFVLQSYSKLNKLSNNVHNTSVYCSFQADQVHQSRHFHFFYPFFDFGGYFGMKMVLLTYVFLILFKILMKFPLKYYY